MIRRALGLALAAGLLAVAPAEAFTWSGRSATGANAGAGVTSATLVPASIAAGNLVVVSVDTDGASIGNTACSDTLGNTYTATAGTVAYNSGAGHLRVFWSVASAGGATPTITCTVAVTTSYAFLANSEYTPAGSVAVEAANGQAIAGTAYDSGNITTAHTDLLIGYANGNGLLPATPASWTNRAATALNANLADRIGATAGTYNFTNINVNAGWGAIIIAFSETPGTGCLIGGGVLC